MRSLNPEFWQGKSVFITGHTGFKGAWLSYLLNTLGARVYGYSLAPEHEQQFYLRANVEKGMVQSTINDIRDRDALGQAVKTACPDIVFHLAAQPLVRSGYQAPLYTFDVNIMGTANMLDAAISADTKMTVISITTDKVYRNREQIWSYREHDELGGIDPYSASKACAEFVIKSYMQGIASPRGAKVGIASVRAGNVIGGGDWSADRLIPDLVKSARSGKMLTIRNPYATRPWQHVLDCLMGYLLLAESLHTKPAEYTGEWNFGPLPGNEWSVERVVNHCAALFEQAPLVHINADLKQNMKEHLSLALDSTKAMKHLNWSPRLSVEEALDYTIREYKSSMSHTEFLDAVITSIDHFLAKDPLNDR